MNVWKWLDGRGTDRHNGPSSGLHTGRCWPNDCREQVWHRQILQQDVRVPPKGRFWSPQMGTTENEKGCEHESAIMFLGVLSVFGWFLQQDLSADQELICQGFTATDSAKTGKLNDMVLVPSPSATIILDGTDPGRTMPSLRPGWWRITVIIYGD